MLREAVVRDRLPSLLPHFPPARPPPFKLANVNQLESPRLEEGYQSSLVTAPRLPEVKLEIHLDSSFDNLMSSSSSKRGRKRNDLLPPNRARDVQRAFRARRAAHLQALEQRVSELEEENSLLRQALDLPPANRPPLGRGPTGNDRPQEVKTVYNSLQHFLEVASVPEDSSSADSGDFTRPGSISPAELSSSMPERPPPLEGAQWENAISMDESASEQPSPTSSLSYPAPPLSAPLPSRESMYPSHSPPLSSPSQPSRPTTTVPFYDHATPEYSASISKPVETMYTTQNYAIQTDIQHHYQYEHSPMLQDHPSPFASQPMPPVSPQSMSPVAQQSSPSQQQMPSHYHSSLAPPVSVPYPIRRYTEPLYSVVAPPQLTTTSAGIRLPSPPMIMDTSERTVYAPDGRIYANS